MWVESETVPMAVTAEQNFDLSFLSREETQTVLRVLERDRHLKMIEAERVGRLFPGRDTRLGMKNSVSSSPQRAQTVWSTMLPVSPVQANPPPIKASPRLNTQANPPPMKALPRLNTQANTESQAGRAGDSSGGVGKHPSLRSRLSSLLSIPFLQRKSNSRDGNISRDVNISRDGNISRDVNISSGHRDMGSSSRGTDASSSSSISRPQQVNRHGISSEESQAIRKQREITERDKQTESSFPGTHLKAESCTDQTHREKHDRQSPDISRPTKSASRPASLLTTRPASLSEGTSPSPSPEQDRHTVGISIPNEDGPLPSKADEDEDEDEDSREASLPITPDDTSLCCVPLTSDREIKKDVNQPISGV
ncbi:uncharacterized protein LOC116219282 [Clupea harengus]|uniref:Uncharacterized protein LOC116219282 n=1 Tax=Clupea harengus TaxID=7950 RepID=A0A6P8F0T7_CLUHA|nr:uncharacterized protein LOC116219282 [Clupea harengus]